MEKKLVSVVTYSDDKTALTLIADNLLQLGIPSVHLSVVESWYRWKGKRCFADEYKLDILCTKELLADVIAVIKRNHNYEVPAITWVEVVCDDNTYAWGAGVKF